MSSTALSEGNAASAFASEGKLPVQSFPLRVISLTVCPGLKSQQAVAIELDFVNPILASGNRIDQRRQLDVGITPHQLGNFCAFVHVRIGAAQLPSAGLPDLRSLSSLQQHVTTQNLRHAPRLRDAGARSMRLLGIEDLADGTDAGLD